MSRRLASVFFAMLVLTMAMGLKTAVTAHGSNSVLIANGPAPAPRPWLNGPAPAPRPWLNGPAPAPRPWKNGPAPAPRPW